MDAALIEHAIVTLAALAAAGYIGCKVFRAVKPSGRGESGCASCPSAQAQRGRSQSGPTEVHPLKLLR